jgi:hypothetical protein
VYTQTHGLAWREGATQQRDSTYDEARPAKGLEAAQRVRMVATYRRAEGRAQRGCMGRWEGNVREELGYGGPSVRRGRGVEGRLLRLVRMGM